MAGRAGRAGIDTEGEAILVAGKDNGPAAQLMELMKVCELCWGVVCLFVCLLVCDCVLLPLVRLNCYRSAVLHCCPDLRCAMCCVCCVSLNTRPRLRPSPAALLRSGGA